MITETSKKVLYAAVGAPVVTARKLGERISGAGDKVTDLRDKVSDELTKELESWASEGEKLIQRIREREGVEDLVDDLADRVDLDQIQEHVGRLRENLDDLLQSWRSSFKPAATPPQKIEVVEEPKPAPAPKKPAARKPAAKKTTATAAKKPAAKKTTTTTRKPAAKKTTSTAKTSA